MCVVESRRVGLSALKEKPFCKVTNPFPFQFALGSSEVSMFVCCLVLIGSVTFLLEAVDPTVIGETRSPF